MELLDWSNLQSPIAFQFSWDIVLDKNVIAATFGIGCWKMGSYYDTVDSLKVYPKHYLDSWQWHECEATEGNMM